VATHDYVIANGTGAAVRSDLNGALAAIVSNNSSATQPATMYAYQWWADTTAGLLKIRNSANSAWVTLFELDGTLVASDISLGAGTVGAPSLFFTGDSNTGLFSPGADTVALVTGGTNRVHVTSGGLVGIGTTLPSNQLTVGANGLSSITLDWTGDNAAKATFSANHSTGEVRIGATNNSGTYFTTLYSNNNEAVRIDSSRRLLVGTSTDQGTSILQVQGEAGAATAAGVLYLRRGLTTAQIGANVDADLGKVQFGANDGTVAAHIQCLSDATWGSTSDCPGRLVFSTTADGASSPTERMRITSGGQVLINRTSVVSGFNSTLSLDYTTGTQYGFTLRNTAASTFGAIVFVNSSNSLVGEISVSTTATAYNTSSDYRLKENVTPVPDGITRLQQLKPSRFNFISDPDKTVDGFIAHEAQAVVPECVTGEKDAVDDDGNPKYQGIDQSKLVPLLTAALQEAIAKIEALETRLSALEAA